MHIKLQTPESITITRQRLFRPEYQHPGSLSHTASILKKLAVWKNQKG